MFSFSKKIIVAFLFLFLTPSTPAFSNISVVEISGKQIPELQGKEISKINLRVFRQGQWKPIPFQIDEKSYDPLSKSRRWVLDQAFSRRTDLVPGDGKWDEDESLLFMSKDMAEKALVESTPEHPVLEIRSGSAYAYLFYDPKNFALSSESYVKYNPAADEVDALGYKNSFSLEHPIIQEALIPKNQKVGKPENILDRFKIRMLLGIKHFFDVHVEEDNITAKRVGYRAGPIRIIRRLAAYKSLGPFRVTPKAVTDFLFYPYFVQIPSQLDNPIDGRKILNPDSKGFAGFDFTRFFYGSKFYSEKNIKPVWVDGTMSGEEKNLVTKDVNWWVVTGNQGSLLVRMDWDPRLLKEGISCDLYYRDDQKNLKPPEMDPGEAFVGFALDFTKIPAGNYMIYVNEIFPPADFKIGDEKKIFGQVLSPSVEIR